jgi:O-antigen/teichoic acid export membrane protein
MNDDDRSFFGSLKWAFTMTWADRAFSVAFTLVLAAILGPRDFGIVALALIYIAVVQLSSRAASRPPSSSARTSSRTTSTRRSG